ncbi:cation-translocating P-type ATPase [Pedobacter alluvionis]|nr:cation-translocating P-type ATPase [Pedobacter alluvionis]
MEDNNFNVEGLSNAQVLESRNKYGSNILSFEAEDNVFTVIFKLLKEPMIIILLIATAIYCFSGDFANGIFLLCSILFLSMISLYQDSRSRNALEKLKLYHKPTCKVIREGALLNIPTESLVIGDSMVVEEGTSVPADGLIFHSNDFSVNESLLTGESLSVFKDAATNDHMIFHGTTIISGLAIANVTAIGMETRLGKVGISISKIPEQKTPLERQVNNFVKNMVILGAIVFLMVWGINFLHSHLFMASLLQSLTLAMSIIPEEIPVAFTSFMALGAWRLIKMGIVVKQMKTVETLGSATVICTDKTGTLTENQMSLDRIYLPVKRTIVNLQSPPDQESLAVLETAMWASEPIPFDPMEISIHDLYKKYAIHDERPRFFMRQEYALSGRPPMMTHIFEDKSGSRIIAAKGAPEAIISVCHLTIHQKEEILEAIETLSSTGHRVLGVASASFQGDHFPATQQEFAMEFAGLIAFTDPPKKNIRFVLNDFYHAGITVKIITGDNAQTTSAIAKEIGLRGADHFMNGDELMKLSDDELRLEVVKTNIFTRMFPEAKLRIINALKANHEIVAMTGDGVNDGPALKAAHIGIAMGKKGTEIAKQAASLILPEDDLSKMVDAIAMGRKIYANLKKAIQYIISIHIPIILCVFIPLALGWRYPNLFSPLHIIFLELIMGPTCSIIYENEPMEKNAMLRKPRLPTETFFSFKELFISMVQGLVIALGALLIYKYATSSGFKENTVRTMTYSVLVVSNIFLTLANRSFFYSVLETLRYKNKLVPIIICITISLTGAMIYITPVSQFFGFAPLTGRQLLICLVTGFISVIWLEGLKFFKRINTLEIQNDNSHTTVL